MKIVVPGDYLSDDVRKAGEGTYIEGGKVYSLLYGIADLDKRVRVIPLEGKYIPREGDWIIGTVVEITFANWVLDINSPYIGLLHVSEYPKKIEFGDMEKVFSIGDSLIARIKVITPSMKVMLALKEGEERPLRRGRLVEISHTKVPRLIGRKGSMITMIQRETGCSVFVGQNGRVWIKGPSRWVPLVADIVRLIEKEAHTSGLTDKVLKIIRERKKRK
ncbi:RNA-binding protein [Methanosarcinales archaeon]|nr:MAG: RNA-binding protein [Methanosarcinales archaeon]